MGGQEIDRFRGRFRSRDDKVALVFAVLVIDKNEHPALARLFDDVLSRGERGKGVGAHIHVRRSG